MGKPTGFLEIDRAERDTQPVAERVKHFEEFVIPLSRSETAKQAARCMDCGIPFCHTGCPVNNQIPDWNDLVYNDDWEEACRNLHTTNNFPEMTGRICPAPCEASCTLNIDDNPVAIKSIECAIADRGFAEGWIRPEPPTKKTGKRVAVIGSGPAGMAAAQQLARVGHDVHVYEKNAFPGGLLRYGIPDFKMEKKIIERRVAQMEDEGVTFHCSTKVGEDVSAAKLVETCDAVLLAAGSEVPRDLNVDGRDLTGVHFAMNFLPQQNRRVSGEQADPRYGTLDTAEGKHVVVIGGGDTGSDCIGTSFRQGAASVTQLEIMPAPPEREDKDLTWPHWPLKFRTSTSQAEGANRDFSVITKRFEGEDGQVKRLIAARCDHKMQEVPGSEFAIEADLVLLAMGFTNPVADGMLEELSVGLTDRRNVAADEQHYATSVPKVFAAGDVRRGQSLVVWAIREGRQAAHAIDRALMGATTLPR
ncbi:MAG: glutamate synthase subunit beta [Pseudomonadota bacterium]